MTNKKLKKFIYLYFLLTAMIFTFGMLLPSLISSSDWFEFALGLSLLWIILGGGLVYGVKYFLNRKDTK